MPWEFKWWGSRCGKEWWPHGIPVDTAIAISSVPGHVLLSDGQVLPSPQAHRTQLLVGCSEVLGFSP